MILREANFENLWTRGSSVGEVFLGLASHDWEWAELRKRKKKKNTKQRTHWRSNPNLSLIIQIYAEITAFMILGTERKDLNWSFFMPVRYYLHMSLRDGHKVLALLVLWSCGWTDAISQVQFLMTTVVGTGLIWMEHCIHCSSMNLGGREQWVNDALISELA